MEIIYTTEEVRNCIRIARQIGYYFHMCHAIILQSGLLEKMEAIKEIVKEADQIPEELKNEIFLHEINFLRETIQPGNIAKLKKRVETLKDLEASIDKAFIR